MKILYKLENGLEYKISSIKSMRHKILGEIGYYFLRKEIMYRCTAKKLIKVSKCILRLL